MSLNQLPPPSYLEYVEQRRRKFSKLEKAIIYIGVAIAFPVVWAIVFAVS